MEKALSLPKVRSNSGVLIFDLIIISFIYFLPAISHLLAFPIYYFDPMRIALVFALLHTTKRNTFIIAITLPLFSFIISSHPSLVKSGLIAAELIINILLFFVLYNKIKSQVIALTLSIILSKVVYYFLKFTLIEFGFLSDKLFSTPFYYQIITLFLITLYVFTFEKLKKHSKKN